MNNIVELLRERAMTGRMEVRDKQLMLKAADEIEAGYSKQIEGKWVEDTEYYDDDYSECNVRKVFVCSKCGRTERRKEPYCNCGAKMKGGAK